MTVETETGASAAPTVDAGAGSPAPSETSAAPEKPSRFSALMAEATDASEDSAGEADTDGDGTDTADDEESIAEKPDAAPKPEAEAQPDDSDVPADLKAVLKKHPELRAAHFYKKGMDPLGISVDEAQEYRESIQSLEDLRMTVNRAKQLDAFEGLFTHSSADAPLHFLEGLKQVDADAANRFVRTLGSNLKKIAPETYYEIGGEAWEVGLKNLDALAGDDPFRREAVAAVREMVEELSGQTAGAPSAAAPKLPAPDAKELAARRDHEDRAKERYWNGLRNEGNHAADQAVRGIVAEIEKRRDPDGLLIDADLREKIVHEIHTTVAGGSSALHNLFLQTLYDTSLTPAQRVAKAASLVKVRAQNVADLVFERRTKGIADRIRKVSQNKLGKAAKAVSIREATGGRPASTPAPQLPRGERPTSRDIFRAAMKG